jgi:hypothetical protein
MSLDAASHMKHPSPFYDEHVGTQKFTLLYPGNSEHWGPYWNDAGELTRFEGVHEDEEEEIEAVPLGDNRYRLTEKSFGPLSFLKLEWGDEFLAEQVDTQLLKLTQIILPRRFAHFRFIGSPGFSNDNAFAVIVHELGGGWETVMGGFITLTVPISRLQEFQQRASATGQLPGVLQLEV